MTSGPVTEASDGKSNCRARGSCCTRNPAVVVNRGADTRLAFMFRSTRFPTLVSAGRSRALCEMIPPVSEVSRSSSVPATVASAVNPVEIALAGRR